MTDSTLSSKHPPRRGSAARNAVGALAGFTALLLIGAGAAFALNAWQSYNNQIDRAVRANVSIAHTLQEQTTRTVQSIDLVLSGLTDFFRLRTDFERPGSEAILELLRRRMAKTPDLSAIIIVGRDGRLVYHTDTEELPLIDLSDRDYFAAQRAVPGPMLKISEPFFGRLANRWYVGISRRINDADGEFAGVVVGVLAPEKLSERYSSLLSFPDGAIELFLSDGTYLAHDPFIPGIVGRNAAHTELFTTHLPAAPVGTFQVSGEGGAARRLVAYRAFSSWPLVIAVSASLDQVMAEWRQSLVRHGAIALLFGTAFALVAYFLIRQISRRMASEAALAGLSREIEVKSEQLSAALANMSQGLCMYDADQRLILCNRRYLEIYNLPAGLVRPGITLRQIMELSIRVGNYAPDRAERLLAERLEIGASKEDRVMRQLLASGRTIEVVHRPLPTGGCVATFTDITDQETVTADLRNAKEQAEFANRAKSEFLANMSHELRTPLNAIIGFSQIMTEQMFGPIGSPRYREYAGDILNSSQHLLQIINDILDMAKIEAGRVVLHEAPVEVARLAESCFRLVGERAESAGVALRIDIAPDLPDLLGDERLVKQILLNLLSNAVKFTPRGGRVTISGRVDPDAGWTLSVIDTGIGITAADIPRVMQPFGQVDGSYARKHGGTGLGLSIVRALAELHGGTFRLDSTPGEGTTATVSFGARRVLAGPAVARRTAG